MLDKKAFPKAVEAFSKSVQADPSLPKPRWSGFAYGNQNKLC